MTKVSDKYFWYRGNVFNLSYYTPVEVDDDGPTPVNENYTPKKAINRRALLQASLTNYHNNNKDA